MKIAIYGQHAIMAGRRCFDEDKIERESDDVIIYEGTRAELLGHADMMAGVGGLGPNSEFTRRVGRTLAEAVE